jgi:LysR family transcriptional regulator, hypochlorite-specific transcription factor HypT
MQLKWLEDLLAVAEQGSFKSAAQSRHVTPPAFGRRLRALEQWAGVPLFEANSQPVRLTAAGQKLVVQARATARDVARVRTDLQQGDSDTTVRVVTGRALSHGFVADALAGLLRPQRGNQARVQTQTQTQVQVHVLTRLMSEASELLERDEADILLSYQHPALALKLDGRRYLQARAADDRLVPVVKGSAQVKGRHKTVPTPAAAGLLGYDPAQALGRLMEDHLSQLPQQPELPVRMRCDSVDSLREYALRGFGVAWLPRSMVAADLNSGLLVMWDNPALQIPFETRLYRRKQATGPAVLAVWNALVGHADRLSGKG